MRYNFFSDNIIFCENYLSEDYLNLIYMDLLNARSLFNIPKWREGSDIIDANNNSLCSALDFWIRNEDIQKSNLQNIIGLSRWFFHQGLKMFIKNYSNSVFKFLEERKFEWDIHVISYNKNNYYNWHTDGALKTVFTFNLVLQKPSSLTEGKSIFYDPYEKTIPVKHNFLTVFPSYVPHAMTPLIGEKEVAFAEQRFSIQFWCRLKD
tara:strand:- start:958 stop:1578 length:621 start_codon:yes stop_codon:yes gene_type:complete